MPDLREEIESCLRGRVCIVGVGNTACGDDGVGVRLAEALRGELAAEIVIAGDTPERCLARLAGGGYDAVLFLDAVDFRATPGSAVLLDAAEMAARFPQVSTHRVSLGTLAKLIESGGNTRVRLLGVQPASLREAADLTPAVGQTLGLLVKLFAAAAAANQPDLVSP